MMVEGKLSPDGHATVMAFIGLHGGRVEDALIENEIISEGDLLRYVATIHNTRFVSTEKLYKTQFDPKLAQVIPRKLADQHCVYPVMYDDATRTLSIITPDPDNLAAINDVKIAAGVREVTALVARPAAVRAVIAKVYYNDFSQFTQLMRGGMALTVQHFHGTGQQFGTGPSPLSPAAVAAAIPVAADDVQEVPAAPPPPPRREPPPPPRREPPPQPAPAPAPVPAAAPAAAPAASRPAEAKARVAARGELKSGDHGAQPPPVTLTTEYVETLNVLVSLLESARPDLRGHSAQTARLMKKLCDRMGLAPVQTVAYVVAAYFHDIGKAGTYHLTALNVGEYEGHRTAAQKVFNVPERFLQAVTLHADTKSAVNGMYERFDGRGFPAGLAGNAIPLGARLLAAVDAYCDVTSNPRNPARKLLKPAEAVQFLGKYRGTFFDPTVLDLLRAEVAGEDLRAKLLAERNTVLIVDPDPEESTVLELRLLEAGFDVRIARTYQQALIDLQNKEIAVVVSEVDLETEDAGLTLRSDAANAAWGQNVRVWIIHTRKTDRQLAEIVFDLGVDDLVSKPTPPEVFVTKMRQLIERKRAHSAAPAAAPRGVSGSLAEMGLPEVVQILWHGRKTCTVKLKTKQGSGDIGFADGQIVDARFGAKRGEEAFYTMLVAKEGDFQIDPNVAPTDRTIEASPEGLLLEGMRRMDEGLI